MYVTTMSDVSRDLETFDAQFVQVVIPLSLQRRVEGLLQEHLDRVMLNSGKENDGSDDAKPIDQVKDVNLDENTDSFVDGSVMEKVLQRRSLRMRNMQRTWRVYLLIFVVCYQIFLIWCHLYYHIRELLGSFQLLILSPNITYIKKNQIFLKIPSSTTNLFVK